MLRKPSREAAPVAGVTLPPHVQPKPSRILHIQVEPWELDPNDLAVRDRDRLSRLAEWKRALIVGPERQAESNSTCSTKLPSSSVEDLCEEISRGAAGQWCGAQSFECIASSASSANPSRAISYRELGVSSNATGLSFEYGLPSGNPSEQQEGATRSRDDLAVERDSLVRNSSAGSIRVERSFSDTLRPPTSSRCRPARSQSDLQRSDATSVQGGRPRARSIGRRTASTVSLQSPEPEAERSVEKYMSQPVLTRLCDTKYYTGRQRKRFDEGFGEDKLGKATQDLGDSGVHGYKSEIYLFPRSSTSPRRPQRVGARTPSPMVCGDSSDHLTPLKVILVFRNADQFHDGERIVIHRHIRTLSALYKRLTEILKPYCVINELYNAEFVRIGRVDELEHGEKYLACEGQGPTSKRHLLTKFLTAPSRIH